MSTPASRARARRVAIPIALVLAVASLSPSITGKHWPSATSVVLALVGVACLVAGVAVLARLLPERVWASGWTKVLAASVAVGLARWSGSLVGGDLAIFIAFTLVATLLLIEHRQLLWARPRGVTDRTTATVTGLAEPTSHVRAEP